MDKVMQFFTMEQFRRNVVGYNLMSEKCFGTMILRQNFLDKECATALLSKVLGLGLVTFAAVVKLPQILKILSSKSAAGLSLLGNLLELTALMLTMAYSMNQGFPFSAYGDAAFLMFQTFFIVWMIFSYTGRENQGWLFVILFGGLVAIVTKPGLVPDEWLWWGQAANIPMAVIGKMIQVYGNFKNGHTGQMSAVTVFLLAGGSSARIFTSIQETGDPVMIATFVASTSVNYLLVLQVLWYWGATNRVLESREQGRQRRKNK